MRLRSSRFVFLLLLVCSVQGREEYALRLVADAVSGHTCHQQGRRDLDRPIAPRICPASLEPHSRALHTRLDAASLTAHTTPWSMRRPALEAAAVSSFTGFVRI